MDAADQLLQPIDGGWRVKETATHWIDVVEQIFSWRVVRTPKSCPMTYDRAWCYNGKDLTTFATAVVAAWAWDGADDTAPEGWNKNKQTGEWRPPAREECR